MIDHKEIKIISLALKYKSDQFNAIDVGGFNGHWTDAVINLNKQSKITIFEPDQDNLLVLKNKYANNNNIHIVDKGASNEASSLTYYKLHSDNMAVRGGSGFVSRDGYKNHDFSEKILEVIRIDDIINSHVDLMKIDTEGFEFNAIKGCEKLLSDHRINFIQFEYGGCWLDAGIKLNEVISYLKTFGYFVYDMANDGNLTPVDSLEDNYLFNNFVATHLKI
jgi:FkbM family methyltransferase